MLLSFSQWQPEKDRIIVSARESSLSHLCKRLFKFDIWTQYKGWSPLNAFRQLHSDVALQSDLGTIGIMLRFHLQHSASLQAFKGTQMQNLVFLPNV